METISNFCRAVAAFFGWKKAKLEVDNSPEMQANAKAQTDATDQDRATTEVKDALQTGDLDELRKDAAE